jgi:ATP-dependent DNA helicase RecQ
LAAVEAMLIDKKRTLVVQPTGWGKSAVYWIAAKAVRESGGGIVLVVSPLLALMRNQVESATKAGLKAASINSSATEEWAQIEMDILADRLDIIFISPERLANPGFRSRVLSGIKGRIGLLVIDEAHCISSWGHDFRPDYQLISNLLLANSETPVLCTTATANNRVTEDIATQLGIDTFVLRGQLTRDSLHLAVISDLKSAEQFAWVADAVGALEGSGIVYTQTIDKAERLTNFLAEQGYTAAAYHGRTEPEDRLRIENLLMSNKIKVVVATSALGMGYDKPDLAFCIHVGSPGSPIDYYQQIGRAGRSLEKAMVVLISDPIADPKLWEHFATSTIPKQPEIEAVLKCVQDSGSPLSSIDVSTRARVTRNTAELLLKTLSVDNAIIKSESGWLSTNSPWEYPAGKYAAILESRKIEAGRMAEYARAKSCLETQLRISLDDVVDPAAKCGRCSVCVGKIQDGIPSVPKQTSVVKAQQFLRGIDNPIETRKRWPKDFILPGVHVRNTIITANEMAQTGRSLGYADDPAWGEEIQIALRTGQLSDSIKVGLRDLIERWRPDVTTVVPVPSSRNAQIIISMAKFVADGLGATYKECLDIRPPFDPLKRSNTARRPEELATRIAIKEGLYLFNERVLLVDDTAITRWTSTISSAILRTAGAESVKTLVLHQFPGVSEE